MPLKKHRLGPFLFHYFLSSIYVIFKWIFTPALIVAAKLSQCSRTANKVDEFLNRIFLPLTEKPGNEWRRDAVPDLRNENIFMEHVIQDDDRNSYMIRSLIFGHWSAILLIRGAWCSYSRMHMSNLQDHYHDFLEAGIKIIAIASGVQTHWWQKDGIEVSFYVDKEGSLFSNLGIRQYTWTDKAWGRIVPFEGVLLFNPDGKMFDFDLRHISGIKTGQEFLSAEQILKRFSEERSGYEKFPG